MYSHYNRGVRTVAALSVAAVVGLCLTPPLQKAQAQQRPTVDNLSQKAGRYAVELRVPAEGLFAGEETDIEFHVTDTSQDDPVQGAPPIVNAKVAATVTMPTMRSMPAQKPKTHTEGVPGDYGVVVFFPHGGDFKIDLLITPPKDNPFTVSFKVPVNDAEAAKGRTPTPKPYSLEVTSDPVSPRAGEPADLTIVVRGRDTKQPVTDYDVVHERQIHFMVVSADLQHFAHEHPVVGEGGKFRLKYTFPTGGGYRLFADVAPRGAGSQILMQPIHVAGTVPASLNVAKLPTSLSDTAGGIRFALQSDPSTFPIGRSLNLTFTLKDDSTGAPITDLEPYLGAMGHMMLIHQDGATFVHSHPDESDPKNGHDGTITFMARFPRPGVYRGWLQVQRAGQVQTAAFTWTVKANKT